MKIRIGNKLQVIREERRLTQAEMADILSIPTTSYARIERNETLVPLEKVTSIAESLNIPIQELLPETLTITNNNNNSGQGGGVIFGNQYFYFSDSKINSDLIEQNQRLQNRIEELERLIREKFKADDSTIS